MSLDITLTAIRETEVFEYNITHNLNRMAGAAGIYEALWRPDEIEISTAEQLIPLLEKGLESLKNDPEYYKTFNPENGWGTYEGLVEFVDAYLKACKENPDAKVYASR